MSPESTSAGPALRITQQLLLPRPDSPAFRRMHPVHPATQLIQHLPVIGSQLLLDPDRQIPATLSQRTRSAAGICTNIVPGLQVIKQLSRQAITPRPGAGRLAMIRRRPAAPAARPGRCVLFLASQDPPDPVRAVIPVDQHPAPPTHTAEHSHRPTTRPHRKPDQTAPPGLQRGQFSQTLIMTSALHCGPNSRTSAVNSRERNHASSLLKGTG
jgi:hypothetical protein